VIPYCIDVMDGPRLITNEQRLVAIRAKSPWGQRLPVRDRRDLETHVHVMTLPADIAGFMHPNVGDTEHPEDGSCDPAPTLIDHKGKLAGVYLPAVAKLTRVIDRHQYQDSG
jgi:hypothetical protein